MKQFYIYHKPSNQYGTAIIATNQHIVVQWHGGFKTLFTLPCADIEFHYAGDNIAQPALTQALPHAIPLMQADQASNI